LTKASYVSENPRKVPLFRYFLDSVQRLGQNSYIPTTEDILHTRVRTSGIVEVKFNIKVWD
jgi:hypothetical protein